MGICYMGTSALAAICLEKLTKSTHEITAVVTRPPKPAGRGKKLQHSPVYEMAQKLGLPTYEFSTKQPELKQLLQSLKLDAIVVVAYGEILKEDILNMAQAINLHGSLLPAYRGPSPIQTAILNGDKLTGVTIMKVGLGIDDGDIISMESLPIEESDTTNSLSEKLALLGAPMLVEVLDRMKEGCEIKAVEQDHSKATYTKKITKEDGYLDFANFTAEEIVNKVRALSENPGTFMIINEKRYKIYGAKTAEDINEEIIATPKDGIIIKCKKGAVEVLKIQAPSGKILSAGDFLRGNKLL